MLAALAAASIQSCSSDKGKTYHNRTDVNANGLAFIKGAHEGSLTEIEASKLAQKNSTNKEVTEFAAMMLTDHRAALADIDTLAYDKHVFVEPTVSHDTQIELDSLSKRTGAEFDKEYMALMVKGHEEAKELFGENKESNYTEIRELVDKLLPKINEHAKKAEEIKTGLK